MKYIAKFVNADNTQTLTVIGVEGKTGFNVRVSHKVGEGKANTGMREQFQTEVAATNACIKLTKAIAAKGWTKVERANRNAFDEIPEVA